MSSPQNSDSKIVIRVVAGNASLNVINGMEVRLVEVRAGDVLHLTSDVRIAHDLKLVKVAG